MKKTQNTNQNPFCASENYGFDYTSMKSFSSGKGSLKLEIFQHPTTFNEKLPIIYANIRV